MTPVRIPPTLVLPAALLALAISACNTGPDSSGSADLRGIWFACEEFGDGTPNADCRYVDDDGIEFASAGALYSVDGAGEFARKVYGDAGAILRIDADSLWMFRDDTATYAVEGDSIAFTMPGEDGDLTTDRDAFMLSGDFLTIYGDNDPEGRTYRRYRGKSRVMTLAEFQAKLDAL